VFIVTPIQFAVPVDVVEETVVPTSRVSQLGVAEETLAVIVDVIPVATAGSRIPALSIPCSEHQMPSISAETICGFVPIGSV
jgi:hypothetical protein